MTSPLRRLRDWDDARQLQSTDRSGTYARRKARLAHRAFVRNNWRLIGGLDLAIAACTVPALVVAPPLVRSFIGGVVLAGLVGMDVAFVVVLSGTAATLMGELAEVWTAESLRKASKGGWRVVQGVRLRNAGDIDHVAIGPGGVLVVETKWSGSGWGDGSFAVDRLEGACRQVAANQRDVWHHLRRPEGVRAVVVLWALGIKDVDEREHVRRIADVDVVIGPAFDEWLRGLRPALDDDSIARLWTDLERTVRKRDAIEAQRQQPMPRSPGELLEVISYLATGFAVGLLAPALLYRPIGHVWWWLPTIALPAVAGVVLRCVRSTRPFGTGLLASAWFLAIGMAAIVVYAFAVAWLR
jgi:hypothetical protein